MHNDARSTTPVPDPRSAPPLRSCSTPPGPSTSAYGIMMPRLFSRPAAHFFAIVLTAISSQVFAISPKQPSPPVMRLGDAVKPLAYDAELSIVPENDNFSGKITIDVDLVKPQNFFWLNADKIDVKNARLTLGNELGKETLDAKIVKTDKDFVGL